MKKAALAAAVIVASIVSAARFYVSGIRQPVQNFYGDFLGIFPSLRLSVLLGRLDMYRGSLAEEWAWMFGDVPVWHYGPIFHLVTLPPRS